MTIVVRIAFVVLMLLGISARAAHTLQAGPPQDRWANLGASLQRLGFDDLRTADTGLISARMSGCKRPVSFDLLPLDTNEGDIPGRLPDRSDIVRIVYMDHVDDAPDHGRMVLRWMLARAEFVAGFRHARPSGEFLLVAIPATCPSLGLSDWAALSP